MKPSKQVNTEKTYPRMNQFVYLERKAGKDLLGLLFNIRWHAYCAAIEINKPKVLPTCSESEEYSLVTGLIESYINEGGSNKDKFNRRMLKLK